MLKHWKNYCTTTLFGKQKIIFLGGNKTPIEITDQERETENVFEAIDRGKQK